MNKKTKIKILVFLFLIVSVFEQIKASKFDFNGYYTLYQIAIMPPAINGPVGESLTSLDEKTKGLIEQHLRLQLSYVPSDVVYGEIAYELMPFIIDRTPILSDLTPEIDYFTYRISNFHQALYPDSSNEDYEIRHNLDRFFVVINTDLVTTRLGRQPISFGSARIINPTNVLAPIAYGTIGIEQPIGVDALRFVFPLGVVSDLDIGTVFGRGFRADESAYFARVRFDAFETDIALLSMIYREHVLTGLDITRSIYGAGLWLESAYTFSKAIAGGKDRESFFRASAGLDYNFNIGSGLYAALEYHYNGASINQPENYLESINSTAYIDSGVYLLGRHYLIPRFNFDIIRLLNIDISSLINLKDSSTYLVFIADYNVRQNTYIGLGALIPIGKDPAMTPEGWGPNRLPFYSQSEFGLYPGAIYTYFKIFF